MEYILARVDTCASGTDLSKQITVLNAVKWCGKAWDEVSERTIKKCFLNCGFKWDGDRDTHAQDGVSGIQQTENCSELLTAAQASGVRVNMTAEEFVAIDDNIATESMDDWEEDLVRSYVEKMKDADDEDDDDGIDDDDDDGTDDDDDDDVIILVLTIREAYPIALSLQRLQEDELTPMVDDLVSKMEKKLVQEKLKGL